MINVLNAIEMIKLFCAIELFQFHVKASCHSKEDETEEGNSFFNILCTHTSGNM